MNERSQQFEEAYVAFRNYLDALRNLNAKMAKVGIKTPNVEPLANFAEVIVAREFTGAIQPPTNEGFDVLCEHGKRIQVKSLRVSSAKPEDNWLNWYAATRKDGKKDGPLIAADTLAVVVYLDSNPYAQILTPVVVRDSFPVVNVKDLLIRHVDKLLAESSDSTEITATHIAWTTNDSAVS